MSQSLCVLMLLAVVAVVIVDAQANIEYVEPTVNLKNIKEFKELFEIYNDQTFFMCESRAQTFINGKQHVPLHRALGYQTCFNLRSISKQLWQEKPELKGKRQNVFDHSDYAKLSESDLQCVANLFADSKRADDGKNQELELAAYEQYIGCMSDRVPEWEKVATTIVLNLITIVSGAFNSRISRVQDGSDNLLHDDERLVIDWYERMLDKYPNLMEPVKEKVEENVAETQGWSGPLEQTDEQTDTDESRLEAFKRVFYVRSEHQSVCRELKTFGTPVMLHLICAHEPVAAFEQTEYSKLPEQQVQCLANFYAESMDSYKDQNDESWYKMFDAYEHFLRCQTKDIPNLAKINFNIDLSLLQDVELLIENKVKVNADLKKDRLAIMTKRYKQQLPETTKLYKSKLVPFGKKLFSCLTCSD